MILDSGSADYVYLPIKPIDLIACRGDRVLTAAATYYFQESPVLEGGRLDV